MNIIAKNQSIFDIAADIKVIAIKKDEDVSTPALAQANSLLQGALEKRMTATKFKGNAGKTLIFSSTKTNEHIIIAGVGKGTAENFRSLAGSILALQAKLGAIRIAIDPRTEHAIKPLTEGLLLANYNYTTFKKPKETLELQEVALITQEESAQSTITTTQQINEGITKTRDLVNAPANIVKPVTLADEAQDIAARSNGLIRAHIYDRAQCERMGMGSYLSVAAGSDEPPYFIHLVYTPTDNPKKKIALVGKGITFDSGGLSLKPSSSMETMKCDMAGAATVIGTFATLASLKPSVEVHGIIAATENMPNGKATRPGDIVTAANGKTIEILNTDAEGRLTLADAIDFAAKQNVDEIIDLATLTGASMVGLGEEITTLMSNEPTFAQALLKAGADAGEKLWEMPLEQNYMKLLDSQIADLRNIATVRYGGAITAGLFLSAFVPEGQTWAHMDIAGPAFAGRGYTSYLGKGATGFGVRTLVEYLTT